MWILRKISDKLVGWLWFQLIEKWTWNTKAPFRSVSLNMWRGTFMNEEQVKKYWLKKPGLNFKVLRQIAKNDALIRICVNVIKKSVSQCPWEIAVKWKAPKWAEWYEPEKDVLYELFEFMNPNGENMRMLLDRVLEDLLVLDAWAIEKISTIDRTTIVALNSVDAATVRPIYNAYWEFWDPAYKQIINEKEVAAFKQTEMIYIVANPQNDIDHFWYWLSPIESIMLQVQASMEADMHNLRGFSKNNLPPGILDLWGMSDQEAESFIATWNATVLGNTHWMKFIWGSDNDKKYIPVQTSNRDMQFLEYTHWLSKLKLSTYWLTWMDANILQDLNRATAEVQQRISQSRGVQSYKKLIEEYFTRSIIREMWEEFKWLEFKFTEVDSLQDKKLQAEIDQIDVNIWKRTANELRERDWLKELPEPTFTEEIGRATKELLEEDDEGEEVTKTFEKSIYAD